MKRALKYVLRTLAALLVLVVLAVIFVHTPWGKSFVRGRIEKRLAGRVPAQASPTYTGP